jgi:hypothetical protein
MTSKSEHPLVNRLRDLRNIALLLGGDEARREAIKDIDETVRLLRQLRAALDSSSLEQGSILQSIDQVLSFLATASKDERLRVVLQWTKVPKRARPPKPKRQPVDIKAELTNDEIRSLLKQNLSRTELEAIALQKGLSTDKRNTAELRNAILGFVDKQDNYSKLRS